MVPSLTRIRPLAMALLGVLAFAVGWCTSRRGPTDPGPGAVPVELAPASYYAQRDSQTARMLAVREGVIAGLWERVRGLERRRPERIVVVDSVIREIRDTVFVAVEADRDWRADVLGAIPVDSGHRRVVLEDFDLSRCDNGFTLRGTQLLCRTPPVGHLDLFAAGGADLYHLARDSLGSALDPAAELRLRWKACDRCATEVSVGVDLERVLRLRVERRVWRLF